MRLIWTTRNLQQKVAKALAEFKCSRLVNIFMEPSKYDDIALYKIMYYVTGTGLLAE
jgi:hypothetical protein